MTTLTVAQLLAIEREAERAPYRLLMTFVDEVDTARRDMQGDDAEHAQALLLKLHRLLDEQIAPMAGRSLPDLLFWDPVDLDLDIPLDIDIAADLPEAA